VKSIFILAIILLNSSFSLAAINSGAPDDFDSRANKAKAQNQKQEIQSSYDSFRRFEHEFKIRVTKFANDQGVRVDSVTCEAEVVTCAYGTCFPNQEMRIQLDQLGGPQVVKPNICHLKLSGDRACSVGQGNSPMQPDIGAGFFLGIECYDGQLRPTNSTEPWT